MQHLHLVRHAHRPGGLGVLGELLVTGEHEVADSNPVTHTDNSGIELEHHGRIAAKMSLQALGETLCQLYEQLPDPPR